MRRLATLAALVLAIGCNGALAQDATDWIRGALADASPNLCGSRQAAAKGTAARLAGLSLPSVGKVIVVNIPSGVATAYEDGIPVIESRAVVGRGATPTPEMRTHVTFVRPNPTWTVPESILKRKGWREKLASDPGYFADNGFEVVVGGQSLSPFDAARDAANASAFVQKPSAMNALGSLKIGIENDQAIYLHDTNERGGFEEEVRAASSGCVRVEQVRDLAAWILDVGAADVDAMIDSGDEANHEPPRPVTVVLGYWTAWPDAEGNIQYYPDIYGKDGAGATCEAGQDDGPTAAGSQEIWTEYEAREATRP